MRTRNLPVALADKLAVGASAFTWAFGDVRMEDIATASGIPRTTLYYYFAGRDDILAFLLQSMLDDVRISAAAAADAGDDIETRLAGVVRAQLAAIVANPAAHQLLLSNLTSAGRAGRLGVVGTGVDESFCAPLRRILEEGVRTGALGDVDVEIAATGLCGAVTVVGLQSLFAEGQLDIDQIADALLPIFWSGLAGPRPAHTPREQP